MTHSKLDFDMSWITWDLFWQTQDLTWTHSQGALTWYEFWQTWDLSQMNQYFTVDLTYLKHNLDLSWKTWDLRLTLTDLGLELDESLGTQHLTWDVLDLDLSWITWDLTWKFSQAPQEFTWTCLERLESWLETWQTWDLTVLGLASKDSALMHSGTLTKSSKCTSGKSFNYKQSNSLHTFPATIAQSCEKKPETERRADWESGRKCQEQAEWEVKISQWEKEAL